MDHCDEVCSSKGIPEHLHQLGREVDPDFPDEELLFRRFRFSNADLTSAIKFNEMSVNRAKYGLSPDDVLWNDDAGGKYDGYGVVQFPVAALNGEWRHPDERKVPITYRLTPLHKPRQCNYPHSEVTAIEFNRESQTAQSAKDIKPTSVKMKIREHLQAHVKIVLPPEDLGLGLPMQKESPRGLAPGQA